MLLCNLSVCTLCAKSGPVQELPDDAAGFLLDCFLLDASIAPREGSYYRPFLLLFSLQL